MKAPPEQIGGGRLFALIDTKFGITYLCGQLQVMGRLMMITVLSLLLGHHLSRLSGTSGPHNARTRSY